MKKRYKSSSHVSLNVPMGKRKSSVHVSFTALTGGGSVFYTDDEKLQNALERHARYGKIFRLDPTFVEHKAPAREQEEEPVTTEGSGLKVIAVASLDDAKTYLVETFGISRTKLRSKKQIEEAAAVNGIEFNFA